jgi:hypothetical protein
MDGTIRCQFIQVASSTARKPVRFTRNDASLTNVSLFLLLRLTIPRIHEVVVLSSQYRAKLQAFSR